jgi:hypothetical protein
MAAPFQVFPSPSPSEETEEQIFNIASGIALEYAQNFFWSSWHPWDAVNQGNTSEKPAFWNALAPFGTCLGASTHIFHALRDALAKHADADVQKYVQDVKLVTFASAQYAPSEGEVYHAVVTLCFDTFAIIIDHSLNSTAFKLSLNGEYLLEPYVPMFSSEQGQDRFRYFQTEEGSYVLTMDTLGEYAPPHVFGEMNLEASVSQLAIPAAKVVTPHTYRPEISLPPRKYVIVRSLLDEKPTFIASVPVKDGKFLASTLDVQADFQHPALAMQVPRADWIETARGAVWISKCSLHYNFEIRSEAMVHFKANLSAEHKAEMGDFERQQVEVLASLGSEFGIDPQVIWDMAASIFRVWAPYRGHGHNTS